jgi:hypothetical protein
VTTLALAEDILRLGDADLVGMVRANIADPEILPKSRTSQAASVRPCVGANVCINSLLDHKPLTCLVNPTRAGLRRASPRAGVPVTGLWWSAEGPPGSKPLAG